MTQPFIQNVSRYEVENGTHLFVPNKTVLIQITDPAWEPCSTPHKFVSKHAFEFLDIEEEPEYPDEARISEQQALELVNILRHCKCNGYHVVVHCTMGVCRSGAVAQVGEVMGFILERVVVGPNLRVKRLMMQQLTEDDV
jgi:predicted protein tyrosine phosphatase